MEIHDLRLLKVYKKCQAAAKKPPNLKKVLPTKDNKCGIYSRVANLQDHADLDGMGLPTGYADPNELPISYLLGLPHVLVQQGCQLHCRVSRSAFAFTFTRRRS